MVRTPIALVGAGVIARTHIDRLAHSDGAVLAAIADPAPGARAVAEAAGVPCFADHREMLARVRPAGVIVATPNALHVPVALDCLARGIPVLVEKPVADTVEDARRLVEAQAASGVPVLVGHHRRHNPIVQRARALVQEGRLGRLVAVHAQATFLKPDAYFDVAWRREPGGGPVLINLIHDIDLLRFLAGEVEDVISATSSAVRGFAVEDTAAAVLRFAGGALGTVLASDAAVSPWCWDFCAGEQPQYPRQAVQSHYLSGTEGSLSLPDLTLWRYAGERSWHAEMTREQTVVHAADPYTRQLAHFLALIEGDAAEPVCSAEDGLRTLAATRAVLAAAARAA
ncbi:Gfo/Idh/MocA family protein [Xenophilus azovorans]|uniref:Gfo/Idh/MocA family protein n=1 Tax=Xenophilus azovorans TaxID=151755 RepID=UPI00056F61FE|nr:Gfo/Idh/MocA family oxidoreductase [Xenophilus azovorans]